MKTSGVLTLLSKAAKPGPLPYLAVAAAILGVGVVLQMRSATTENLPGGGSLFGLMAQLGGAVGLFGLLTLAIGEAEADSAALGDGLPVSAFDIRLAAKPAGSAARANAATALVSPHDPTPARATPAPKRVRLLAQAVQP